MRPSLCLTLVGSLIVAAPVRADTEERPVNEDAPNVPAVAPVPDPQPGTVDANRSLMEGSRILRGQIDALRLERREFSLGGPITMLSVGGVVAFGSLVLYSDCRCFDHGMALLGISGAALAVVGAVSLNNHQRQRRELANEINAKIERLRKIEHRILFSAILGPNNLRGAALALKF